MGIEDYDPVRDNNKDIYPGDISISGDPLRRDVQTIDAIRQLMADLAVWSGGFGGIVSGSWTPGLSFNNGTTGIVYSIQQGAYVKVGRLVHCGGRVALSNKGSSTGAARLTGFPFMSTGNTNSGTVVFNLISAMTGLNNMPFASLITATSAIFRELNAAGTASADLTDVVFTNTTDLRFTTTYVADS